MQRHEKGRPGVDSRAALTTASEAVQRIVPFTPSAGGILAAVDAIHGQQTYTREQVTYLTALAYRAGRVHAAAEDIAEDVACWREYAHPLTSREQRIAERLAEMAGQAAAVNAELGRPPGYTYRGGPVAWETGAPA